MSPLSSLMDIRYEEEYKEITAAAFTPNEIL